LIKLLIAVILLIIGALVAGAYFEFNPAIPISGKRAPRRWCHLEGGTTPFKTPVGNVTTN